MVLSIMLSTVTAIFAASQIQAEYLSGMRRVDAERYSESTERYRKCLADADRRLARICDVVMEVCAGIPIIHKGASCL